ncbi:MAG: cytochrome c oxidase assembly factor Coa1 family protein [Phycisphaeraceae bacterium]
MEEREPLPPHQQMNVTPPPSQGWWGRNWRWFVPLIVVLVFVLVCGCCAGIFYVVYQQLRVPYDKAVVMLENSPEAAEVLGEPIQVGSLDYSQLESTPAGDVVVVFPVQGARTAGIARAEAVQVNGTWEIAYLELVPEGADEPIVIHDEGAPGPSAPPDQPIPEQTEPPAEEATPAE